MRGFEGRVLHLGGALAFTVGDWLIEQLSGKDIAPGEEVVDGRGLAIVLGKVLDGVPESFVLGISLVAARLRSRTSSR